MKSVLFPCLLSIFAANALAAPPQYSPRKDIATGLTDLKPNCLGVADFNSDGRLDFVVADMRGKNIQVYLNQGGGNFSAPVITTQSDPTLAEGPLVVGDFDEDGKKDLIVFPYPIAGGTLVPDTIFYSGNGDGTFTQRSKIPKTGWFFAAIAADLNQDSHLDLLSGSNPGTIAYGDGHGSFTVQSYSAITLASRGFTLGDLNNGGTPEIILTSAVNSPPSNAVLLLLAPSFQSGLIITRSLLAPESIATADFNGDGKLDLLIGGGSSAAQGGGPAFATVLLGKGDYTFPTGTNLPIPNSPTLGDAHTAIADVNNDQKPDVVVADQGTNTLSIFLNDGTGTFPQTTPDFTAELPQSVGQLQTADFNGDGLPDIIVTNFQNQNVSLFLSQTTPVVSLTSTSPSVFTGSSVNITAQTTSPSATPTGTITLMDGATSLGQQPLNASGAASFSLSNLSPGQHSLTASYSGDSNFTAATSAALTQSVTDFQVALPTASQTVTAGGSATYSLTITPAGGLAGSITVTCSQLPSLSTCDPITIPINGQPATATLTVHTTAPVTSKATTIHAAAFGLLSFTLLPFCRRRSLRLLAVAIAFTAIGLTTGCGGSGSSSSTKPPTVVTPGTPQGTTPFTITSSITLGGQTLTRTSTATLVVQ